jgi:hypothetical protein
VSTGEALCFSAIVTLLGIWLGHTTKLPDESQVFLYAWRRYLKYGGWLLAVGGLVIMIRILLTILGVLPEPE